MILPCILVTMDDVLEQTYTLVCQALLHLLVHLVGHEVKVSM